MFHNGLHILYVNGKYRGNDEIGKLMHNFSCTNPEDMRNKAAQNKAKKTAIYLIKLGKMTLEEIAEATELSLNMVKELENQSMQLI